MLQFIDKSAIVAELETRYNECLKRAKIINADYWNGCADAYRNMLVIFDTLEVKDVDLEKEYEEFVVDDPIFGNFITNDTMGMELAKHFFELGLKAQKGE